VPDVSKLATFLRRRQDSSNNCRSPVPTSTSSPSAAGAVSSSPVSTSSVAFSTNYEAYLGATSTSTEKPTATSTSGSTNAAAVETETETEIDTSSSYLALASVSTISPISHVQTSSTATQQAVQAATPISSSYPPLVLPSKTTAYLATTTLVLDSTVLSTDPAGHVETSLSSYTTTQAVQMTIETGISTIVTTDALGHVETIFSSYTTTQAVQMTTETGISTIVTTDALGHMETILSSYTTTQALQRTTQTGISTIVTTDASGHTLTIASSYTTVETLQPTPANTNSTQDQNTDVQTVRITWPLWWVFITSYLPIILALLVKMFWTSVYANVKLIEPFIQLSKPDGARASDTLHAFYFSSNLTPDPILAFFKGRWLIFWTSLVYFNVGLLAPFASEVLFLDIHYGCGTATCWPPRLSADGTIVRILQGLLFFIATMTLAIMAMLYQSTTGVYSNPSSIAAIAALLHHPETLDDFRHLEDNISSEDMKKELGDKRYQMGTYQQQDGVWRYGIVPASQTYSPGWTQIPLRQSVESTKITKQETHYTSTALDVGFVLFVLGLLGVVVAYFMDGSNSGFNRFFNSNEFGPRFFMVFISNPFAVIG
jgi:hypothetical protein